MSKHFKMTESVQLWNRINDYKKRRGTAEAKHPIWLIYLPCRYLENMGTAADLETFVGRGGMKRLFSM